MPSEFRVGLASAPFSGDLERGLRYVEQFLSEAAKQRVDLVCFPESFLPGMRGIDEDVAPHSPRDLEFALSQVQQFARRWRTALILPMDWDDPAGILNIAFVISAEGKLLGRQTKNQLDPSEDAIFVAGNTRQVFEVAGVRFGISICHEGFRYPETVRWAAVQGASIVFHPHCTGSNKAGQLPIEWQGKTNGYYEHAMTCRALENEIYFASVNYAFAFQKSATCVVSPQGECISYQPYGQPGLLVVDIDPARATRSLAVRYNARGCAPCETANPLNCEATAP
jgi:predicted amidohydrolase